MSYAIVCNGSWEMGPDTQGTFGNGITNSTQFSLCLLCSGLAITVEVMRFVVCKVNKNDKCCYLVP